MPCYETIAARDAAYPAPRLGQKIGMRRLCGNGYFEQMYNGTRWESFGSIIKDAGLSGAGYSLTATSTAYVVLASYTIPAGMIGDGEEWEGDFFGRSASPHGAAASMPRFRLSGANLLAVYSISSYGRVVRSRGACVRLGTSLTSRDGVSPDLYSNTYPVDTTIDPAQPIIADAGWQPGTIGDVLNMRFVCLRRIG